MSESQAERVKRIAATAGRSERALERIGDEIRREWWIVTLPGSDPAEIFFCPAQSRKEILASFPKFRTATIDPLMPK